MARSGVQILFLNVTLRLYLARAILICSLQLLSISVQWIIYNSKDDKIRDLWILLFVLIFVHNLASFKRWRFFYGLFDILLIGVELGGTWWYIRLFYPLSSQFPETLVLHAVLCWTIFISLMLLAIFRVASIITTKGRHLWTPFDISTDQDPSADKHTFSTLLMGRSIWKEHFTGETLLVRSVRGILGLIFLAAILFFIFVSLIYNPMKDTALSPVKEYRTTTGSSDLAKQIGSDEIFWNVLIPLELQKKNASDPFENPSLPPITLDDFLSAVNVAPLPYNDEDNTDCVAESIPLISWGFNVYVVRCRAFSSGSTDWSSDIMDLDISANFTLLVENGNGLDYLVDRPTPYLPVSLALTQANVTVDTVLSRTIPTTLVRGISTMSSVASEIRQIFNHPALASLGFFQSFETFWVLKMMDSYTNIFTPASPDSANLRLWLPLDLSETIIVQDSRDYSVISGFSAVGGLWTTLSGIFTIIFGASMLRILYGSKPLSIYGVAHSFQSNIMRVKTMEKYPDIMTEHKTNHGLLALLRDHLIDLRFLEAKEDQTPTAEESESKGKADEERGLEKPYLTDLSRDSSGLGMQTRLTPVRGNGLQSSYGQ